MAVRLKISKISKRPVDTMWCISTLKFPLVTANSAIFVTRGNETSSHESHDVWKAESNVTETGGVEIVMRTAKLRLMEEVWTGDA